MNHRGAVMRQRTEDLAPSLAPTRLLIANADADARAGYRNAFVHAGYEVVEASDGRDALVKAFVEKPVLIVTELALPFLDGCALCDILSRDPLTAAVPILVVTAEANRVRAERALRVAADGVVVEPTTPDTIVCEARRILETPRERRISARGARYRATASQPQPDDRRAPQTRRVTHTRAHQRFTTTSPPKAPPALSCPTCDRGLKYEQSHVGGVNDRHAEQWDYFVCPSGYGVFQYRHRTRRVRRVE